MKISVLTPSYNSGKYIERAIQSVLRQDYKNWEHIIVDGGSNDGTLEILKKYPHLRWISEPDKGQSDAMNKAFNMSKGEIVVYLNADDYFFENIFDIVSSKFNNDSSLDIFFGGLLLDDQGEISEIKYSTSIYKILHYRDCTFPSNPLSYFYRRELQEAVGEFPVNNHFTMDYWFLLRALRNSVLDRTEHIFGVYYFDGCNKSSNLIRARKELRKVRNEFLVMFPNLKFFKELIFYKLKKYLEKK